MEYGLTYNVDIVFCIDCTESMDNILDIVKGRALSFYQDLQDLMASKDKHVDRLRVRVVAFRDYLAFERERKRRTHLNLPMLVSDFFELPGEAENLDISVRSLEPVGGGDAPEDGLEALAYAIRSDWSRSGFKNRHVIVLWSDNPPHELGFGRASSAYPRGMAKNMDELTRWWGDRQLPGYMPDQSAKRLILYAPNEGEWRYISDNWDQVIHCPSKAGDGLRDVDYDQILTCIANTI